MLVASIYFWDATHNTFHLPCGMVTPTLFDVASITGLHPLGEDFDPNYIDTDTIKFGESKATYTVFTVKHHNKDSDDVSDEEHIAFLALWLSMCVFCSRSLQVAKRYLALENQLNSGRMLDLSQMILGYLYECLGESADLLRAYEAGTYLLFVGPFWLLQLWLNATFETVLPKKGLVDENDEAIKNRTIEGTRLTYLTPRTKEVNCLKPFKPT
ncbi:uncharacterized protein LOC131635283 [Vicia villosa]|uniref:uncharacterized protein LOC131635283 n=1 Tax=Vicia villosa TaxID=3911 RepID=UPI00273B422E|nr:uncharacterized protein LOC131635283 [Vicia villosa]